MNFFLVSCKSRKKFDKYVKINRVRNKYIIDIKKILEEEEITVADAQSVKYFKILIYKKIQSAKDKKKDIYYIPNFDNPNFEINRIMKMKELMDTYSFNLLHFFNDFKNDAHTFELMEQLSNFDASQIIKDY